MYEPTELTSALTGDRHTAKYLPDGAGKTTSLKAIAGLYPIYRGNVTLNGKVGLLPQNPQTLFVKRTVREDLYEALHGIKITKEEKDEQIARVVKLCNLQAFLDRHPYDISGGEQQRTALAKVLLTAPDILLLDEPTKGFDAEFKVEFAGILKKLTAQGVTILMVSHDVVFCAEYTGTAEQCRSLVMHHFNPGTTIYCSDEILTIE